MAPTYSLATILAIAIPLGVIALAGIMLLFVLVVRLSCIREKERRAYIMAKNGNFRRSITSLTKTERIPKRHKRTCAELICCVPPLDDLLPATSQARHSYSSDRRRYSITPRQILPMEDRRKRRQQRSHATDNQHAEPHLSPIPTQDVIDTTSRGASQQVTNSKRESSLYAEENGQDSTSQSHKNQGTTAIRQSSGYEGIQAQFAAEQQSEGSRRQSLNYPPAPQLEGSLSEFSGRSPRLGQAFMPTTENSLQDTSVESSEISHDLTHTWQSAMVAPRISNILNTRQDSPSSFGQYFREPVESIKHDNFVDESFDLVPPTKSPLRSVRASSSGTSPLTSRSPGGSSFSFGIGRAGKPLVKKASASSFGPTPRRHGGGSKTDVRVFHERENTVTPPGSIYMTPLTAPPAGSSYETPLGSSPSDPLQRFPLDTSALGRKPAIPDTTDLQAELDPASPSQLDESKSDHEVQVSDLNKEGPESVASMEANTERPFKSTQAETGIDKQQYSHLLGILKTNETARRGFEFVGQEGTSNRALVTSAAVSLIGRATDSFLARGSFQVQESGSDRQIYKPVALRRSAEPTEGDAVSISVPSVTSTPVDKMAPHLLQSVNINPNTRQESSDRLSNREPNRPGLPDEPSGPPYHESTADARLQTPIMVPGTSSHSSRSSSLTVSSVGTDTRSFQSANRGIAITALPAGPGTNLRVQPGVVETRPIKKSSSIRDIASLRVPKSPRSPGYEPGRRGSYQNDEDDEMTKEEEQERRRSTVAHSGSIKRKVTKSVRMNKPLPSTPVEANEGVVENLQGTRFTVLRPYRARLSDEIDVNLGDVVEVYQVFDDGWCLAKIVSSSLPMTGRNRRGICPRALLAPSRL